MERIADPEACVDRILERVGKRLRVGTPLALGKPAALLNALYRRAQADPAIDLHIMTALTLERPRGQSDLEKRFLGPFVERVWGDCPDPEFERDRVAGTLPDNVRVLEFYFYAGKFLDNAPAQRDYISTNYTYVARDLVDRGVNVLLQEVCEGEVDGEARLSLSSNPDVTLEILASLRALKRPHVVVGQLNSQLPFMFGDAVVVPEEFDIVVDNPELHHRLFGTPKTSVSDAEFLIGIYASTLVKDGGELQVGIGSIGDALVYALKLRHEHNDVYQELLRRLRVRERFGEVIDRIGDTRPFEQGLFGGTEMLVDGFMHLIDAGIVKRRVYDDLPLQRLLNAELIDERPSLATLDGLLHERAIRPVIDGRDLEYLKHWGVLRPELSLEDVTLTLPDGRSVAADITDAETRSALEQVGLGEELRHGRIVHAAFFLGPEVFYQWLRDMPEARRRRIDMRSVARINQLYGHEELDRLHRRDARFVNTAMMVTLSGAVVSDGLEDGRVVSGVGGQYNFVAMSHALPDGHSILQIRSTRQTHGEPVSNLVFNYGHTTIPRHQRDIVVTEYGIADVRGRTDEEVAQALIAVADSRFQEELLEKARRVGKLRGDFELASAHCDNLPEHYGPVLEEFRARGYFPKFPFGTDLTEEEIVLGGALRALKAKIESARGAIEVLGEAVVDGAVDDEVLPYLKRMGLDEAHDLKETLYQRLLAAEVRRALAARG
ncbi:MAG: acetyl-CoA hydrolase/transferase C-terminal domain-containing protein [Myxococcales bacterium]|jgi:hypothetical protein